jgi:hypothetical protein
VALFRATAGAWIWELHLLKALATRATFPFPLVTSVGLVPLVMCQLPQAPALELQDLYCSPLGHRKKVPQVAWN